MVNEERRNQILLWKCMQPWTHRGMEQRCLSQLRETMPVEIPCLNVGNMLLISTCSPGSSGTLWVYRSYKMFPQVQGPRWCVCVVIVKLGVKLIQMTCESPGRQEMGSTNFHEVGCTWLKWVLGYTSDFSSVPGSCRDGSAARICPGVAVPQPVSWSKTSVGSLALLPLQAFSSSVLILTNLFLASVQWEAIQTFSTDFILHTGNHSCHDFITMEQYCRRG